MINQLLTINQPDVSFLPETLQVGRVERSLQVFQERILRLPRDGPGLPARGAWPDSGSQSCQWQVGALVKMGCVAVAEVKMGVVDSATQDQLCNSWVMKAANDRFYNTAGLYVLQMVGCTMTYHDGFHKHRMTNSVQAITDAL